MASQDTVAFGKGLGITYYFGWLLLSQSIEDNTSLIQWSVIVSTGLNGISSAGNTEYTVVVDGQTYTGTADFNIGMYSQKTVITNRTTIKHNTNGTKTFSFSVDSKVGECQGSGTGTLDSIVRPTTIVSAPNFTDEESPTITYSNPSGNHTDITSLAACISFTGEKDDIPYREINKIGTSYTFALTNAERTTLRNYITSGDSATVRFYIRTTINGTNYHSSLAKTLTLVNYMPTLTPNIKDTNARTIALTGDSNKLIKYYSNASVTFGASAKKGATIVDRRVICGSQTIEIEDSAQDTVTLNEIDSDTFYMRARDSRGNVVERAPLKALVPYVKLTNRLDMGPLAANGSVTFTISGKYYNGSFGAKSNTLEVEYSVRDGDNVTWYRLGHVTPTMNGDNYTYTRTITGLDYSKAYEITVNAIDELTPVQTSARVVAATPVFDWGKDDFRHHTNVYMEKNLSLTTNNSTIRGRTSDGRDVQILGLNSSNNTVLGWGGYDTELGSSAIYGKHVYLNTKENVYINGSILSDFVVDQASNGTWFYRKWNSGRVELYGYQNISSVACNIAIGGMYQTAVQTPPNFPFTVNNPKTVASYEGSGNGAFVYFTALATTSRPGTYYLMRPTSSTGLSGQVIFHVNGTWK